MGDLYELNQVLVKVRDDEDGNHHMTINARGPGTALDEWPVSDEFVEEFKDHFPEALVED